jgi:hypothetical protein
MADTYLTRFLGLFHLSDANDPTRVAAVSAAGEVSVAASQIGEVQANPTANTVLDRLKALATALAGTITVSGPTLTTTTATIADGAELSDAVDCRDGRALLRIFPPGNLYGVSSIKAESSPDGVDYTAITLADQTTEWSAPLNVGKNIYLDALVFAGNPYIKFVPNTPPSGGPCVLKLVR